MSDRYLVTGAQGFFGRYLVSHLLGRSDDASVLGIGRSPRQDSHFLHSASCRGQALPVPVPEALHPTHGSRYKYLSMDLSSGKLAGVIRTFQPTAVIHLAASLRGLTDELILHNNIRSTESLLDALKLSAVRPRILLLASTGGVYGSQENQPLTEERAPAPVDVYARSKLACEDLVSEFARQSRVRVTIARIFNVLGPGQDELHVAGRLASQISAILAHSSAPIIRTGSLESSRDFLDVRDVCAALITILDRDYEGICNVGSGIETTIGELLAFFVGSAGLAATARVELDTTRTESVRRHVAGTRLLAAIGFTPEYSVELSCRDMLAYYARFIHTQCAH
jgi:nucleoside-diphosphate-sugar epimerase